LATSYLTSHSLSRASLDNVFAVVFLFLATASLTIESGCSASLSNVFSSDYSGIPKLVKKAVSCCRDIDPVNELTFLQINYGGYDFLIAPDDDQCVFAAYKNK